MDRALRLPPVGIDRALFFPAPQLLRNPIARSIGHSTGNTYKAQKDNTLIERTHHPAQGRISRFVGILPANRIRQTILSTRTADDDFRPKRQGIMNFTDLDFATVIQSGILPYS